MLLRSVVLVCIISLFLPADGSKKTQVKLPRRADLFNLGAYAKYEKVPEKVLLSATFDSEDSAFAASRSGRATTSHGCSSVKSVPRHLTFITRYNFYRKYTHAYGVPIVSSYQVSDRALKRACNIVRFLLADRDDLRQSIYRNFARFGVIARNEQTTTIPEFRHLPAWWNTRARGLGGVIGRAMSCAGEENLLCLPRPADRYNGDDIFFHESAHNIAEVGLKGGLTSIYNRLAASFRYSRSKWRGTYAYVDAREYFAEGMQSFFANHPGRNPSDGTHNYVNTRAELKSFDVTLYNIIREVYPCMNTYTMCSNNFLKTMRMDCGRKTTIPVRPPTGCSDGNCRDKNPSCASWARSGECQKNPGYMKTSCCKSCSGGSCSDKNTNCSGWSNYCRKNTYVKKNCKKTCGTCPKC